MIAIIIHTDNTHGFGPTYTHRCTQHKLTHTHTRSHTRTSDAYTTYLLPTLSLRGTAVCGSCIGTQTQKSRWEDVQTVHVCVRLCV